MRSIPKHWFGMMLLKVKTHPERGRNCRRETLWDKTFLWYLLVVRNSEANSGRDMSSILITIANKREVICWVAPFNDGEREQGYYQHLTLGCVSKVRGL